MATAVEVLPIQLAPLLESISGRQIEEDLFRLAQYGGERLPDGRWSVSRLAFSPAELAAREFLTDRMQKAGMRVDNQPFGLVGWYPERNDKQPVSLMSHFDTVPNSGIYDGAVGVMSAIEVVNLLNQSKVVLPRPLQVVAFTGEESSRFNVALLGSKAAYFGLTDKDFAAKRAGDLSLEEALKSAGFSKYDLRSPYFGTLAPLPYAALELHISQDSRLVDQGYDLGIVEAIAAPDRFQIQIGHPIAVETSSPSFARYLRATIAGIADHSGATPMGDLYRADGLVAWSKLISEYFKSLQDPTATFAVGSVSIAGQALNKIPGTVETVLRFDNDVAAAGFKEFAMSYGARLKEGKFGSNPICIEQLPQEPKIQFFAPEESLPRYLLAAKAIQAVCKVAEVEGNNIVGTVGTFDVNTEGQIVLGVDIRGINTASRDFVVQRIQDMVKALSDGVSIQFHHLSSSLPTVLDPEISEIIEASIKKYRLGLYKRTFSPAGHDIQNPAEAEVKTGLIFEPSENNGISHNPAEYSTRKNLEKGAKAFAAAAITLAYQ